MLVTSSVVSADEKYPAADFQPTIVYQSNDVKSTQTAAKEAAPAAAATAHHAVVDSKYPAADFQPKVLYSDNNYKHDKSVPVAKPLNNNTTSASASSEEVAVEAVAEKKKEDSSITYFLGLIGLAAAGFFLFRQQATPCPKAKKAHAAAPASTAKIAATTGVGKYINKVSGTGVSRYVEQQVKTAKSATSVSKYVAQKTLADKARAAEEAEQKATGVEKYVRNRG